MDLTETLREFVDWIERGSVERSCEHYEKLPG